MKNTICRKVFICVMILVLIITSGSMAFASGNDEYVLYTGSISFACSNAFSVYKKNGKNLPSGISKEFKSDESIILIAVATNGNKKIVIQGFDSQEIENASSLSKTEMQTSR